MINERLKTALNKNEIEQDQEMEELVKSSNGHSSANPEIETTQEEIEGFLIVKAILRQKVSADRISYRDAKSFCAILLDGQS